MKKFIISGVILLLLFLITQNAYSQKGLSFYSSNAIGANLTIVKLNDKQIMGELKVFANRELENISTEIDLLYQFKQMEYHRFGMGIGLKFDPFTEGGDGAAIVTPLCLELFPFQKFKKVSFLFELTPEFFIEDRTYLRSLVGIKYSFSH